MYQVKFINGFGVPGSALRDSEDQASKLAKAYEKCGCTGVSIERVIE